MKNLFTLLCVSMLTFGLASPIFAMQENYLSLLTRLDLPTVILNEFEAQSDLLTENERAQRDELFNAIKEGDLDELKKLMQFFGHPELLVDSVTSLRSPLLVAASFDEPRMALKMAHWLLNNESYTRGFPPTIRANYAGTTPLHAAVATNNIPLVKLLLLYDIKQGIQTNINKLTLNGASPLSLAIINNNIPMAALLIANGADRNQSLTPLSPFIHLANSPFQNQYLNLSDEMLRPAQTPLQLAIETAANCLREHRTHANVMASLLLSDNIDGWNLLDHQGQTLLHNAAQASADNQLLVRMLLKYIDPTITDAAGRTALSYAIAHNNVEITHLLLNHLIGAEILTLADVTAQASNPTINALLIIARHFLQKPSRRSNTLQTRSTVGHIDMSMEEPEQPTTHPNPIVISAHECTIDDEPGFMPIVSELSPADPEESVLTSLFGSVLSNLDASTEFTEFGSSSHASFSLPHMQAPPEASLLDLLPQEDLTPSERLYRAIEENEEESVSRLLEHEELQKIGTDQQGNTLLHRAASSQGNITRLVGEFMNGAHQNKKRILPAINARNKAGQTPIDIAIERGNSQAVNYLLEQGAFINRPHNGLSAIQQACILAARPSGSTSAHAIALPILEAGTKKRSKNLLHSLCTNITKLYDEHNRTLLHLVSQENGDNSELIQELLKSIDPTITDDEGRTALHLAAAHNNQAIVAELLADRRVDATAQDDQGRTPNAIAVAHGHLELASFFAKKGRGR